jgi:glycogen operon protein
MLLGGDTIDVRDPHGEPIRDDTFLILINSHHEAMNFVMPGEEDVKWELLMDTRLEEGFPAAPQITASGDEFSLMERSFALFRLSTGEHSHARTESWKKRVPAPTTGKTEKPEKPAKTKSLHEKRSAPARG